MALGTGPQSEGPGGRTFEAVRRQLEDAGRLDTYLGATALALAERVDAATAVMGFAALAKQLQSTMVAALEGTQVHMDLVDELRDRREQRRATAG